MKKQLILNNNKLTYTDSGQGQVIVLLHGYLESLEIWNNFSNALSKNFRVITFDIPGHGNSDLVSEKHSMESLAIIIQDSLKMLNIKKCFMIGHSMGGYLTLMFHKLFPDLLSGFCLFHSHPFADTEETIKKRLREIALVKEGKKELIAKYNIPNAFASENLQKFKSQINNAIEIALQTPENGIFANLYAMMNRPVLSESLANTEIPFLYIVGEKDNYIDFNSVVPKVKLPKKSHLIILKESGHMGFIEEEEKSLNCIKSFIKRFENKKS
ncbi:alpha/beta fold hydrolase [Bacteroidota bacterium]